MFNTGWGGLVRRRCRVSYVTRGSSWYCLTDGQGLLFLLQVRVQGGGGGGGGSILISSVSSLSFSSFPPYTSLSSLLQSLLSLFLPFSGRWHKMTHKVNVSLNPKKCLIQVVECRSPEQIPNVKSGQKKNVFYVTRSFDGKKFSLLFGENKENDDTNASPVKGLVVKGTTKGGKRNETKGNMGTKPQDSATESASGSKIGKSAELQIRLFLFFFFF